jgi:hypothetical protein
LAKERKRITDGSGCMMGQTTRRNIQTVSFWCINLSAKLVRYCKEKLSISFSDISSWTAYRYSLLIFWEPPTILQ